MHTLKVIAPVSLFFLLISCQSDETKLEVTQCKKHYQAESYSVAARICKKSAESGDINSQWLLANLHLNKLIEAATDEDAVHWLTKAANNAHTAAQRELGLCYWRGRGVEQDGKQALKWFRLAARQNDEESEFYIGAIYLNGVGDTPDPASALTWFKRAAAKGHKMAINNIAWIYATSSNPSLRNGERAIKLVKPLVDDQPERAIFVDTLAAAYAENQQYDMAVEQQKEAIQLLSDKVDQSTLDEFNQRLASYEANQPWRETKSK
ncbi:MAG: sel1 repeat family protein [Gammaproteobacteria bacterium]|nr:sel1 repeat family protein [Gammaproteobacteria bacterium]